MLGNNCCRCSAAVFMVVDMFIWLLARRDPDAAYTWAAYYSRMLARKLN
jgi:hypothetical protein